ncbi:reverse transcriptase-like protein [Bacillus sp. 2205SS5-2]|uniref:reverse transcriptase-like protein n=1 Tax=Bacillus sp. 2205SS5-2 TaxID=3109031 RepID=UPI003004DC90
MVEVYIDGASAGNPGPSGAGIHIKYTGKAESYSIPLGMKNNHEAEFLSFLYALRKCEDLNFEMVSFRSDSQALVNAVEKGFVKREQYRRIFVEIQELLTRHELYFIKWIPSSENSVADALARKAIVQLNEGDIM